MIGTTTLNTAMKTKPTPSMMSMMGPMRREWVLPRMVVESDDEGGVDLETLQRLSLAPAQQPCAPPACAGCSEDGRGKHFLGYGPGLHRLCKKSELGDLGREGVG